MKGGSGVEDGEDEFGGECVIDFDAGFDESVEVHGAFEGVEGSEAFGGELRGVVEREVTGRIDIVEEG